MSKYAQIVGISAITLTAAFSTGAQANGQLPILEDFPVLSPKHCDIIHRHLTAGGRESDSDKITTAFIVMNVHLTAAAKNIEIIPWDAPKGASSDEQWEFRTRVVDRMCRIIHLAPH